MTRRPWIAAGVIVVAFIAASAYSRGQGFLIEPALVEPSEQVQLLGEVNDLAFRPNSDVLAVASALGIIYDSDLNLLQDYIDDVPWLGLSWSPDGSHLATVSYDAIKIWSWNEQTRQLEFFHQMIVEGQFILDVQWSPDGLRLATLSMPQSIRSRPLTRHSTTLHVWWTVSWSLQFTSPHYHIIWLEEASTVNLLAWNPTQPHLLAVIGELFDGEVYTSVAGIHIYDTELETIVDSVDVFGEVYQYSVAWRPDGSALAIGKVPSINLYYPETGLVRLIIPSWRGGPESLAWNPDGSILIYEAFVYYPSVDQTVVEFEILDDSHYSDTVTAISWCDLCNRVALGTESGRLRLFDLADIPSVEGTPTVTPRPTRTPTPTPVL